MKTNSLTRDFKLTLVSSHLSSSPSLLNQHGDLFLTPLRELTTTFIVLWEIHQIDWIHCMDIKTPSILMVFSPCGMQSLPSMDYHNHSHWSHSSDSSSTGCTTPSTVSLLYGTGTGHQLMIQLSFQRLFQRSNLLVPLQMALLLLEAENISLLVNKLFNNSSLDIIFIHISFIFINLF